MKDRLQIAKDWPPRYTGMPLDEFGDYVLLTNFQHYVTRFAEKVRCDVFGEGLPMQAATNAKGLTIINFGIGSANAATIMDLLSARRPEGVLFLGKCGGLKKSTEIGHFILPIAAIRGKGTDQHMHMYAEMFVHSFRAVERTNSKARLVGAQHVT